MTVLHTGWTDKFGSGWDSVFGGKKKNSGKAKAAPKKKSVKKAGAKKASKGKRQA